MLYNGVIEKGEWAVAESCKHALKLDQIKNLGKPTPLPAV
jgi:exoribonuclease II